MKRDMDLVRKILIEIEQNYIPCSQVINKIEIEGYELDVVLEHCKLIYEMGLIERFEAKGVSSEIYIYFIGNLTWQGYDFLEEIREDDIWDEIKKVINENRISMTISMIKSIYLKNISLKIDTLL